MADYFVKGGSRYNEANPTVWCALILGGYDESLYTDVNWKLIGYDSRVGSQDPYWLLGGATGGAKELELGLYGDYRIKFETTGITYWDGDSWEDLIAEGGATTLNELTDVVIDAPANNELLAWDTTTSKWINQTAGQAGLATTGDLHTETHTLASHTTKAHSELSDAPTSAHHVKTVKYTAGEVDARIVVQNTHPAGTIDIAIDAVVLDHKNLPNDHHTLYTLEQHNNTYHSTNYHTETDGTGVVTVHSDITSAGSGIIITAGERSDLHSDVVTTNAHVQALSINAVSEDSSPSLGGNLTLAGGYRIIGPGVSDYYIWSISSAYLTYGLYYNTGTPDYLEIKWAGATTFAVDMETGNITTVGTVDGVDISSHDGGDVETYHTNFYTNANADARIALANHDTLLLPNGNAEEQHMTSAQITALHPTYTDLEAILAIYQGDIGGSVDLNDLRDDEKNGYWQQLSNAQAESGFNYPVDLAGSLLTWTSANGVMSTQTYTVYITSTRQYIRNYYNGTWYSWKPVMFLTEKYTNANAVAAVNAAGLSLLTTKVYSSVEENYSHLFGRSQLGVSGSGYAYFGRRGMDSTNYAVRANLTDTVINVATGNYISFWNGGTVAGTRRMRLGASMLMEVPIAMGTNKITGLGNGTVATDAMAFGQKTVKYTAGEVDARIVVQNTDPDGTIDIAIDALIATHVTAGHTLNQINNPSGDKEFNFANKHLHFKWVAPASGAHEGAFEIEASGAFSGDLMHIHQHTGVVGANTYMVFIECEHANASCLHLEHGANIFDFGANGLLIGADARITEFDTGTLDASDTKVPTSGTVKEAIDLLKEQSSTFPVSPNEGDLHYDEDDDSLYRYNAEALAWIEIGTMGAIASSTDNLGNHTATEDLVMGGFDITLNALSTVDGVDVSVLNTTVGALYSAAQINALLHIGASYKGYAELIQTGYYIAEYSRMYQALANWSNVGSGDFVIFLTTGLPLTIGSLHLHVDYVYCYLYDADGDDYLNNLTVYGKNAAATSTLYDNAANQTTVGLKSYPTGTDDWGDYKNVRVAVNVVATNAQEWEMSTCYIRYWYA